MDTPELPQEEKKETEKERDKKSERNVIIAIGFIILVIAVFFVTKAINKPEALTLDDLFDKTLEGKINEEKGYMYNGYAFVYDETMQSWVTRIQHGSAVVQIPLHYGPRDLVNVSSSGTIDKSFEQREIFITFDPNSTQMKYIALSAAELSLNLAKGVNAIPIAACTTNETACAGRPIVTCDNTERPVIYLKIENSTRVIGKGNCIQIQGKEWELVKAVDRFLLKWYQVMP